jgi:hypothetical protein
MSVFALDELAATLHTTRERLQDLVKQASTRLPQHHYYLLPTQDLENQQALEQREIILAFASADDALTYMQRNGYSSNIRLTLMTATDIILRLLTDPTAQAAYFLTGNINTPAGWMSAPHLTRSELLLQLQGQSVSADQSLKLTADAYDKLQFGIDFALRAAFRAALAEAVEQVVTDYVPPPGSLDHGPRSIFAVAAVEAWLRDNGFPHARQGRWVSVADDPRWGGAVEVSEIEAGTSNRLLVQLVIHADDNGRQYIKWVNVTT